MDDNELRESCKSRDIVLILGKITGEQMDTVIRDLIEISQRPNFEKAQLLIDSGGGAVWPSLKLIDAIEVFQIPVVGCAFGICMSAAGLILQACQERLSTRHARFMPHAHTNTVEMRVDDSFEDQIAEIRLHNDRLRDRLVSVYEKSMKKDHETILAMINETRDRTLDADQALEIGLIDKITDKFPTIQQAICEGRR